jgi:hypothetical protein
MLKPFKSFCSNVKFALITTTVVERTFLTTSWFLLRNHKFDKKKTPENDNGDSVYSKVRK